MNDNNQNNNNIEGMSNQNLNLGGLPNENNNMQLNPSNQNFSSNNSNKKVLGKGKFILHILLSFLVWDFIVNFLFNFVRGFIKFDLDFNMIILFNNLIWISETVVIMFLTYYFNKKHTINENWFDFMQFFILIVFGIRLLLNYKFINACFILNSFMTIILIVIHVGIIYFLNKYLFKHYIIN